MGEPHGHGHEHHHHHHGPNLARSALLGSLLLNGLFLFVELGVGWWSGSLALIADGAHMVSDVAALALAYFAATLATRPATPSKTFGYRRAEVLGAFVNASALLLACAFIFREAGIRLLEGPPRVPGLPILVVATIGLLINLGSVWLLLRAKSNSLNIRAALAHLLADALGSVGAMIAAALVLFFDLYAADAIVGFLTGGLILWGAWGLLAETTRVLLQFAPKGLGEALKSALLELDEVDEVHELHVWSVAGDKPMVTAHVIPASGTEGPVALARVEALLRERFLVDHSTIQIDPREGPPCAQKACPELNDAA